MMATMATNNASFQPSSIPPTDETVWGGQHEPWVEVLISVVLWGLCAVTLIGNTLVLLVFIVDHRVRSKVSNLYILNLSMADFLVGCISIPMNNIYTYRGVWTFGEAACKFWISMDFTACSVSVWTVVLISYDRYMLVTKGLEYDKYQTKLKFLILAGITWAVSAFRNAFAYCGYDVWNETTVDYDIVCDSPLLQNVGYMLYECTISFFIPVTLTMFFNMRLYMNIRRRSQVLPGSNGPRPPTTLKRPASTILVEPARTSTMYGSEPGQMSTVGTGSDESGSSTALSRPSASRREGTMDIKKHRRAAVTLALIVGVSTTCWAIYFSITIVNVVFQKDIGSTASVAGYYVYYANSAINPLLYVAVNPNIRRGIARILFLKRRPVFS